MCFWGFTQEIPPIVSYLPEDYQAENQNWSIDQGENNFIYIANNKGLLEFNGAAWSLYPSPNETIMRSVMVVGEKIYTGCYMEFGYWERDKFGKLKYNSLSDKFSKDLKTDEQFWNILALDDWVLFQSFNGIYIYNTVTGKFKTIDSETVLTKMLEVDGEVYFQKLNRGIFRIVNGEDKLVTDDPRLRGSYLINVFKKNENLLIQTQNNGFFTFDNIKVGKWVIQADKVLENISVYCSIELQNGNYALGTISNGIIIIDSEGWIDFSVNQTKGLSNNTVLSLHEDVENNIWLGLDNGVDCLNVDSPFRIFRDKKGELGTVYAAEIFKQKLFLGTNQGLFFRDFDSEDDFALIPQTKGQVWDLKVYDNKLFISHNLGTFILNNSFKVDKFLGGQGTWAIQEIESKPNLLLQGKYDGLSVLEKANGEWEFRNRISGFDVSSKYFGLLADDKIFVNHEYKGVYKLIVNDSLTEILNVGIDSSLEKGLNSSLVKYDNKIYYAFKKGIFKYDESLERFKKDSVLSQFYNTENYLSGKLVNDPVDARLWGFTGNEIIAISKGPLSDKPKIKRFAISNEVREMMIGYENILNIGGNKFLIGTSSGYILMNAEKFKSKEYDITINSIKNFNTNSDVISLDKTERVELNNDWANIEFTYSVPEYQKFSETFYQYQLEGIYEQWSSWSTRSEVSFENLPFGDYTFRVRSKVGNKISNSTASFSFIVNKPWYATNLAIWLYLLIFLLLVIITHQAYKSYYKKQKRQLILANKRDLELKELETEQQLMQLKNEKLKQDIDNKNRELAISTMSLIKKNEFLSNIKEELKKSSDSKKGLNPVIKIIDKNIDNNDDWKFFQKAFNNADKDFLKKVKSIHPKLTPNDLKLCAYLRLNLTSKEIAPLLNISPRSVEVKRYRLRKKMNLEHEEGLTDYILEI